MTEGGFPPSREGTDPLGPHPPGPEVSQELAEPRGVEQRPEALGAVHRWPVHPSQASPQSSLQSGCNPEPQFPSWEMGNTVPPPVDRLGIRGKIVNSP